MTPYERLWGLPGAESFLRAGVSLEQLGREASRQTDPGGPRGRTTGVHAVHAERCLSDFPFS